MSQKCALCGSEVSETSRNIVFRKGSQTAFMKNLCKACFRDIMSHRDEEKAVMSPKAVVAFSRVQGHSDLFGSDIKTGHFIDLRISAAYESRDFHQTRIYADEEILSLSLSNNQFVELITQMNIGRGTPCTLNHFRGAKVEPYKNLDKRLHEEFSEEVSNDLKNNIELINNVISRMSKETPPLNKTKFTSYMNELQLYLGRLISYPEFAIERFQETLDKLELHTKIEVETFISQKLMDIGLSQLKEDIKLGWVKPKEETETLLTIECDINE